MVDPAEIVTHMKGLAKVGVPYTEQDYAQALKEIEGKNEGEALIAYLMKLGKDVAEMNKSMK